MRISDWSSDVCSSDLHIDAGHAFVGKTGAQIDHQPLVAIAIEIEIHPDLVDPAERQEIQAVLVETFGHRPLLRSAAAVDLDQAPHGDRKSTRLNSSH